jgi:anti-sigma regulatory factor (Ser/Thr protein kinase)
MMLKRILGNLLSNAFRYTQKGGVVLGRRRRGETVEIQILDTGIGIAGDQQQVVFDEFVQLHNPERDREKGLGLGLSIVRRTAHLLGHEIRLVSETGRGSMFSVTLPRMSPPLAVPKAERPALQKSLGIMIVDDERPVLDALTQLLTVWGHRVYAGRSAAEAQQAYIEAGNGKGAPLDLIIVDYRLEGGTTGTEAVRDIAARLGRCPPVINPDRRHLARTPQGGVRERLQPAPQARRRRAAA